MKQHQQPKSLKSQSEISGELSQLRSRLGKDFYLLLAGNIVSVFGSSIYLMVIILYLKDTTGSARVLGFYNFIALLPPVLFGPFAGTLIDRWSRRTVLVLSDLVRGLLMLFLALLALLPKGLQISQILVITALAGLCQAFFLPAVQAIIPEIEPPHLLKRANSARAAGSQLSNLLGNALGGIVYVAFGLFPVLVANGLSFLLSAWQESWIKTSNDEYSSSRGSGKSLSVMKGTLEGLKYLSRRRGLRALVLVNAMVFLLTPPLVLLLPFVVEDTLGLPSYMVGLYFALMLAGGILVYLSLSLVRFSSRTDFRILTISFFLLSLAVLMSGLWLYPWILAGTMFLAGGAIAAIHLMIITTVQRSVGPLRRARVFSLVEATAALSAPFAYLASGFLIEGLLQQVPLVFFGTSALIFAAGMFAIQTPGLGKLFR